MGPFRKRVLLLVVAAVVGCLPDPSEMVVAEEVEVEGAHRLEPSEMVEVVAAEEEGEVQREHHSIYLC